MDLTLEEDALFSEGTSVRKFIDYKYSQTFMNQLFDLRAKDEYTDVTLQVDDTLLSCHRVVLCAASNYFKAMFSSGLEESVNKVIEIRGTDVETVKIILNYIYTSHISITTDNAQNLVQACDIFQFDALKSACESFMKKLVDSHNCIGMFRFAKLYCLRGLQDRGRMVMMGKFPEVIKLNEFANLSLEDLMEYISDDLLDISDEDCVFEAIVLWTQVEESRQKLWRKVIGAVRLSYCTSSYLCRVVYKYPLMNNEYCQTLLQEAHLFKLMPDHRHEMSSSRTKPRVSFGVVRRLVVVGGLTKNDCENRYCWFLKEDASNWELLAQLPRPNWKFYSACVVNGGIFITGGYKDSVKRECFLFDTQDKKWRTMPPMIDGRCKHRAIVHTSDVYVVGGEDDFDHPLNQVELFRFDGRGERKWQAIKSMAYAVSDPLAASYAQNLFVIGGINDEDATTTRVQAFNTVWKEWTILSSMPAPCRLGAAAVFNDKIYILGGYTRSCLSYNPQTDAWQEHNIPREKHGNGPAVVWKDTILLGGGDLDSSDTTSVVEEYNPGTDSWSYWGIPLKEELSCHSMINIDLRDV